MARQGVNHGNSILPPNGSGRGNDQPKRATRALYGDKFPNKASHCEPSTIDSENRLIVRKLIETM
jgi:hypothetical protein